MPTSLEIEGAHFAFVVERRNGTAVYRGDNEYLRLGRADQLAKDLELHRKMEGLGFPVARLLRVGTWQDLHYFVESSVGEQRLNDAFAEDTRTHGYVSDAHFQDFLNVALRFSAAQLKTASQERDIVAFAHAVHIPFLNDERPDLAVRVQQRFHTAVERLSAMPYVLTHGDLNPANMYADGIIDFEDSFLGPLGYDAVTAIVTTEWFPEPGSTYEYSQRYRFTDEHRAQFIAAFDAQYRAAFYPALSDVFEELAFCRAIWHIVRMQRYPKTQKWRFDRFVSLYFS